MATHDGNRADGYFWSALAARLLHPVQVEIIEILSWIDQPLTVTDLVHVFERKRAGPRIEHHLRRLAKLEAVALNNGERPGTPAGERRYRLLRRPRSDATKL